MQLRYLATATLLAWALCLPALAAAPAPGEAAPPFALEGRAGPVSLAAYKGKLVYLDFWAAWCAPCKRSFPFMDALQKRHGAKLVVVAVNVDERREDAERFLAQVPASFVIAYDHTGTLPRQYAIKGMPSSILIGADGRVIANHTGYTDDTPARVEREITAALAAKQ
jgi:cytochrome c biogenesis protein CcmG, thiol:disulfide interchange protein DsbE